MGVNSCGTTLIDNGTFQNIGAVTWDTTAKTGNFTAVSGNGYFVNTTSGSITVTLPSSPSAGDVVGIADYANTADTNKIVIGRNGSNIQGVAADFDITKEGGTIVLVYVDGTQGWLSVDAAEASAINNAAFIVATGGTITTVGDYKFHRFTGPGTFTVCSVGNPAGSDTIDTVIVAGGAGGGYNSGGGGAGGLRDLTSIPVTATGYPITVGGGGAGGCISPPRNGSSGSNSVAALSTSYTSAGGGGGSAVGPGTGVSGGSGGGVGAACGPATGGAGNTPPVSPPQGNPGGNYTLQPGGKGATGGGGATTAGSCAPGGPIRFGTTGGAGKDVSTNYPGQPNSGVYAGGGGGGAFSYPPGSPGNCGGAGGIGGGGDGGGPPATGFPGTTNTGGGGGGGTSGSGGGGGNGGSGIVIIKYKFQ
jgi:hypothetical protein